MLHDLDEVLQQVVEQRRQQTGIVRVAASQLLASGRCCLS